MAKVRDLTSGNTGKLLLLFAFPTLLSNLFQQFYNLADTSIAGHILGDNALVSIGATSSIYSLVITFANGLSGGFGIIMAQCFGAKDNRKLKKSIAHALMINIALGIIICIASIILIKPILRLMNTPQAQFDDAYSYIIVILAAIIVPMLYNLESTVLRSLGDSKTPLYFLIFASLLNIALDYVFIKYSGLGVKGAALATVIAQLSAAILCFIVIRKNFALIHLEKESFRFNKLLFSNMMSAGMAMAMMNSIFSIGSIIMQSAINSLGSIVIAAHLAARKIAEMFMQPLVTIGLACSTFVGQNFGAKKYDRIKESIKYSILYSAVWSVLAFAVLFFFGGSLAKLITGTDDSAVISNSQMYLKINAPFYFVLSILFILRFSIQSINKKVPPLISSSMELISKILAAFVFIPLWGYMGACIAEPLSWCLGAVYLIFAFKSAFSKLDKTTPTNKA